MAKHQFCTFLKGKTILRGPDSTNMNKVLFDPLVTRVLNLAYEIHFRAFLVLPHFFLLRILKQSSQDFIKFRPKFIEIPKFAYFCLN